MNEPVHGRAHRRDRPDRRMRVRAPRPTNLRQVLLLLLLFLIPAVALMGSPAQSAVVIDGSASHRAAASCWEIKQNQPSATDGRYWLITPQLKTPAQFYCDMTTDGGGWVLVGRGRDGWMWDGNGKGTIDQVSLHRHRNGGLLASSAAEHRHRWPARGPAPGLTHRWCAASSSHEHGRQQLAGGAIHLQVPRPLVVGLRRRAPDRVVQHERHQRLQHQHPRLRDQLDPQPGQDVGDVGQQLHPRLHLRLERNRHQRREQLHLLHRRRLRRAVHPGLHPAEDHDGRHVVRAIPDSGTTAQTALPVAKNGALPAHLGSDRHRRGRQWRARH